MKIKLKCSKENNIRVKEKLNITDVEFCEDGEFVITENLGALKHVIASKDGHMILVEYATIDFIEAFGNEVFVHVNNKTYLVNEKLYYFENMLYTKGFIRVNKSQIVNIKHINEIIPWFGQKYVLEMKNGSSLDVNRSYYHAFKKYLGM